MISLSFITLIEGEKKNLKVCQRWGNSIQKCRIACVFQSESETERLREKSKPKLFCTFIFVQVFPRDAVMARPPFIHSFKWRQRGRWSVGNANALLDRQLKRFQRSQNGCRNSSLVCIISSMIMCQWKGDKSRSVIHDWLLVEVNVSFHRFRRNQGELSAARAPMQLFFKHL